MSAFYDKFCLISANPDSSEGENNILYSVENYFLNPTIEKKYCIINCLNMMRLAPGIFKQHPGDVLQGEDLQMSRDQLIAIFAFSKKEGLDFHKEIWKEIKRQLLRYDNIKVPTTLKEKLLNFNGLFQPADLIFYGLCAGGLVWKLFLPIIWLIMVQSTLTKYKVRPEWWNRLYFKIKGIPYTYTKMIATDGKILTWVRCQVLPKQLLFNIHTYLIKKLFGSWHGVFEIFFPNIEHPNNVDSKNI